MPQHFNTSERYLAYKFDLLLVVSAPPPPTHRSAQVMNSHWMPTGFCFDHAAGCSPQPPAPHSSQCPSRCFKQINKCERLKKKKAYFKDPNRFLNLEQTGAGTTASPAPVQYCSTCWGSRRKWAATFNTLLALTHRKTNWNTCKVHSFPPFICNIAISNTAEHEATC